MHLYEVTTNRYAGSEEEYVSERRLLCEVREETLKLVKLLAYLEKLDLASHSPVFMWYSDDG